MAKAMNESSRTGATTIAVVLKNDDTRSKRSLPTSEPFPREVPDERRWSGGGPGKVRGLPVGLVLVSTRFVSPMRNEEARDASTGPPSDDVLPRADL
jgi:hypothetical protein